MQVSGSRIAPLAALSAIGTLIFLATHILFDLYGFSTPAVALILGLSGLLFVLLLRENSLRRTMESAVRQARDDAQLYRKKNEWLRMTESLAHVGHWRMTFSDNQLYWSDEIYRIQGWPRDRELVLEEALDVYHPDDRKVVEEAVETARLTGKPYSFRARLLRPDGEIRHVEAVAKTEIAEDGTPIAMFGVFADRTEEYAMHQALIKASDEAFSAAIAKSTFLANMSHEIRTPMNGVMGFADLLCRSDLPAREHQYAELIRDSAKAMTLLLNDILDLSKIDAGELEMREEPTDIAHLARHVTRLVEPQAREKNLAVELSVSPDIPRLCLTDPLRLRQIVSNLMGNAVKFTESGFVAMSLMWADEELAIEVRDSGVGIAEEEQKLVFDAFAQAGSTSYSSHGGTGLGLAISRQLAGLLGGTLTLRSKLGEGSIFRLSIPAPGVSRAPHAQGQSAAKSSQAAEPGPAPAEARPRVLLAEDYDINQMLVAAMADRAGIDLDVAENGQVALAMVEKAKAEGAPYALLLMDLQMPVMDGLDASIRLRQKGICAEDLPIVAMTANAFPEDVEQCRSAGMQDHLPKPLDFELFRSALGKWLPQDSLRAA